jgi:hypothetical protein
MEKEEFIDDINCGTRVDAKVRAPSICFKKLSLVSWPARTLIFLKKPPSTCRWMLVWDFFLKLHHLLEFFILCCFCKKKINDNIIRTKLRKSLHRLSPFTVGDGPCTSPHPRIVAVASALIRAAATSGVVRFAVNDTSEVHPPLQRPSLSEARAIHGSSLTVPLLQGVHRKTDI